MCNLIILIIFKKLIKVDKHIHVLIYHLSLNSIIQIVIFIVWLILPFDFLLYYVYYSNQLTNKSSIINFNLMLFAVVQFAG